MNVGQIIAARPTWRLSGFQRRLDRGQNLRSQLADVASAEGKDQIAFAGLGCDGGNSGGEVGGELNLRALDACGQALGCYAGDGFFAGCVDGQDYNSIGIRERTTKLVQKIKGSGEPVRLEDDMNVLVAALAGCGQCGANLGGMVAVIVDDGDAARLATQLETPVHAAKVAEAFCDLVRCNTELMGDGYSGGGVEDVVAAGDIQFKRPKQPCGSGHLKAGKASLPDSQKVDCLSRL